LLKEFFRMFLCPRLVVCAAIAAALLPADVTFTESTKFVGGTMVEMMRKMASNPMMGRMMAGNKRTFQDDTYDVYIKGNKMARWGKVTSTIYDLDAGSITTIDNAKRTFTTTTFDEMRQKREQAQQYMKQQQGPAFDFDVKVSNTGQTKMIGGVEAKEVLITMTAKQASAKGQMVVTTHSWLVPYTDAAREAAAFQRKLGEKYAFLTSGPGVGQGVIAAISQAYKQENGFPAEMEVEISGLMAGPMPGGGDPNAPMLKELVEASNFAKGAVDDGKFAVPAGFKEEKRGR